MPSLASREATRSSKAVAAADDTSPATGGLGYQRSPDRTFAASGYGISTAMSFTDSLRSLVEDGSVVWGFLAAAAIVLVLTPLTAWLAPRIGGVDLGGDRPRVHTRPVPRIGGLAIVLGILIPALFAVDLDGPYRGILMGTAAVALVGLVDDIRGVPPSAKLAAVCAIALIPVAGWGLKIGHVTLPFFGNHDIGWIAYPLTVLWIALLSNLINLIDGMDALAAGIVAIAAAAFALLSASFARAPAAALAAIVCGATLGVLHHNHFYHRFMRIGFSQRRTAAYLHVWAALLVAYAVLLRFVPPRPAGVWNTGHVLIAAAVGLVVLAASAWMVYTLEILKARHLKAMGLGRFVKEVDGAVPPETEEERQDTVERTVTAGLR